MSSTIEFETPENVKIEYKLAGLGTRFIAWFTDQLILFLLAFLIVMLFVFVLPASHQVERFFDNLFESSPDDDASFYALGILLLIIGLGNFFYYGLQELFMRGQTIGKRSVGIRVVKIDGFALDPIAILLRNIFRVIDHIPLLWLVPTFSPRQQRLGDMVAGTLLVAEAGNKGTDTLREYLRSYEENTPQVGFSFRGRLGRLDARDWNAIEQMLERKLRTQHESIDDLMQQIAPPLAAKLGTEPPTNGEVEAWFTELLLAEYRRRERQLG